LWNHNETTFTYNKKSWLPVQGHWILGFFSQNVEYSHKEIRPHALTAMYLRYQHNFSNFDKQSPKPHFCQILLKSGYNHFVNACLTGTPNSSCKYSILKHTLHSTPSNLPYESWAAILLENRLKMWEIVKVLMEVQKTQLYTDFQLGTITHCMLGYKMAALKK